MSRDKESVSENERLRLYFTIEKGRGGGTKTGEAGYAVFDMETLTLNNPVVEESLPNTSKGVDNP
jgi:hypothetical protein